MNTTDMIAKFNRKCKPFYLVDLQDGRYAIDTYNVTIDPTLDFSNSAYRFPAVVPLTADQETLNAKAVNMVEYTFQQQIRQYGVTIEKMRETGIRCRILIQASGNDLQTYVFYA